MLPSSTPVLDSLHFRYSAGVHLVTSLTGSELRFTRSAKLQWPRECGFLSMQSKPAYRTACMIGLWYVFPQLALRARLGAELGGWLPDLEQEVLVGGSRVHIPVPGRGGRQPKLILPGVDASVQPRYRRYQGCGLQHLSDVRFLSLSLSLLFSWCGLPMLTWGALQVS